MSVCPSCVSVTLLFVPGGQTFLTHSCDIFCTSLMSLEPHNKDDHFDKRY